MNENYLTEMQDENHQNLIESPIPIVYSQIEIERRVFFPETRGMPTRYEKLLKLQLGTQDSITDKLSSARFLTINCNNGSFYFSGYCIEINWSSNYMDAVYFFNGFFNNLETIWRVTDLSNSSLHPITEHPLKSDYSKKEYSSNWKKYGF